MLVGRQPRQQNSGPLGNAGDCVETKPGSVKVLAQIASAAAVAISLVFVGLEVKETAEQTALNTVSLQVAAYQELISQIDEWNRTVLDPETAELVVRVADPAGDWSQLSESDQVRVRSLLFLLARHADMAYYQFERGMLPEERLESALVPFLAMISSPMARAHWERSKTNFVPAFRTYVDERLSSD